MSGRSQFSLILACGAALAFVGWRFIVPLAAMYLAGVGVEVPFPFQFANAYPRLTAYLFVLGGPALFVALILAFVWLVRSHRHHRWQH